ncbi:MAG TPA: PIN domain-containing protein [bacterium]|nr:PIN domain-containing protein [bacterium]
MTYLLDSNVWLELLFEQERSEDVRRFLETVPMAQIAISEFSVYSIGIALARNGLELAFVQFVLDTLEGTALTRIRLDTADLKEVMGVRKRFRLDFDDAYQYVAAKKNDLTLVSFDADFDRTDRGRKTPADVLGEPPAARDQPPTKPARPRHRKR